jgi:signal transduction histidine kinase
VSAPPSIPNTRSWGSRLTLQGWLVLTLATMGVVVLAGAITVASLLTRTNGLSRGLSDSFQPSRVAAYQMQAALRDQETAVRGYLIAADRQFLEPYFDGQRAEQAAADEIRQRIGDRSELIADLDATEAAAAAWRAEYAEPLIASVTPGRPGLVSSGVAERSKTEFDKLRTLFDAQNQNLTEARNAGIAELRQLEHWRDIVAIAMVGTFFVTALLLAILIRSAVTRPLEALAASCRRITQGNFGEIITERGPKDIRAIASDVENMRQRIVAELDASRAARTELGEQALELQRSNAELEQFAYVASHDLQEPLRKVASFCQLIEKRYGDQLDERGVEYIQFAVDGATRMQVLINDLLTFSRVGRLNTRLAEVDVDTTVDAALANLEAALEESGAQIVRPNEPLPRLMADPTLLTMLWQNLIGNAVKFRRADVTPRVVITCEQSVERFGNGWLFSLSDNGIGIAPEFADKVFVIFQRLHGRDSYTGTGIGLALCKKIVEYHGGAIWIDKTYTGGTRFRFILPVSVNEIATPLAKGSHV